MKISRAHFYAAVQGILRKIGLNITRASNTLDYKRRFLLQRCGVDVVLDVGANVGQYVRRLRSMGYSSRVVSFEPIRAAYEQLSIIAKVDPRWECFHLALGGSDSEMSLNISRDLVSSSLLPVSERYVRAVPNGVRIDRETVRLVRLDSLSGKLLRPDERAHLKLDVQGYELEVLLGATDTLKHVYSIESEMSLVPLYKGQYLIADIVQFLNGRGFDLIWLERGFIDPHSGYLLQVDGLFQRR
jgi:FkbM family methyltransferase